MLQLPPTAKRRPARFGVFKSSNNFWYVQDRTFNTMSGEYQAQIIALKGTWLEAMQVVADQYR